MMSLSTTVTSNTSLKDFFVGVYNRMVLGLLLTAVLAWASVNVPFLTNLLHVRSPDGELSLSIIGFVVALAPIGLIFLMNPNNPKTSAISFWGVAALFGLSMGALLSSYTTESIFMVFLITSAGFAGLSIFGMTTKIDLGPIGKFLIMALIGLIIVMVINIFFYSSLVDVLISLAAVVIFSALTAYDTQKLKAIHANLENEDQYKAAVYCGALTLYLDYINLFIHLLKLLGARK